MKRQRSYSSKGRAYKRRRTQAPTVTYGRKKFVRRTYAGALEKERKYFDSGLQNNTTIQSVEVDWSNSKVDATCSGAGAVDMQALFAPLQGNGVSNREGNKVLVHKISVKGEINVNPLANQNAGYQGNHIRIIIVLDTQTNATAAAGNLILGSAPNANQIHAFQSTANFGRFRVLYDKVFKFDNPNFSWDGTNLEYDGLRRYFKFTKKFKKPLLVRFNNTNGGTVADIVDNSFHLYVGRDNQSVQPTCSIMYQCRTVFTE